MSKKIKTLKLNMRIIMTIKIKNNNNFNKMFKKMQKMKNKHNQQN